MLENPRNFELRLLGSALVRPESVKCTANGDIFTSAGSLGLARLAPDGTVRFAANKPLLDGRFVANGIAIAAEDQFLVANIGDDGGIWRYDGNGFHQLALLLNGSPPPPVNFVTLGPDGAIWATISTCCSPRSLGYRRDVRDGMIVRIVGKTMEVMASGLHYTNEICFDASGQRLYVSETFGHRVTRFDVSVSGALTERSTVAVLPSGSFVDGLAFDESGCLWAPCIVSNRLYSIDPETGTMSLALAETDEAFVSNVVRALDDGTMGRDHFDMAPGSVLRNISSVAFSGRDRRLMILGNLLGTELVAFQAPSPGVRPPHWEFEISADLFPDAAG